MGTIDSALKQSRRVCRIYGLVMGQQLPPLPWWVGSVRLMVGFDDLKGLFQPKRLYDSNNATVTISNYVNPLYLKGRNRGQRNYIVAA